MRKQLGVLLLMITIVVGCGAPKSVAPPVTTPLVTTPPVSTPLVTTPQPPAPPVGQACLPQTTAMELPSSLSTGTTLRPPDPAGTPERPWLGYLSLEQLEVWEGGGSVRGSVYIHKDGTATVDTNEFWLRGLLMPAPSADWYGEHVTFDGVQPTAPQIFSTMGGDDGHFHYNIPAGRPGDSFVLTFTDVLRLDGSRGDFTVTFCRQSAPTVAASYQGDGRWMPVASNVPTEGPLALRLSFSAAVIRETVERALTGEYGKEGRKHGEWISRMIWVDDQTVELIVDQPLPVMPINLRGAQGSNGLFVVGGLPNLYAGAPPRVVAVDPISGAERRIIDLMPEPEWPNLSPDGEQLRITTRTFREGYEGPVWSHALIDLTTATSKAIRPEEMLDTWLPSGELIYLRREGESSLVVVRPSPGGPQETLLADLPSIDSYHLSPDGKWVAVLLRDGAVTEESMQPVRFVLLSTDGKIRKRLDGTAQMWRPGKDGITLYGPAWSPDSTRLALTQTDADGPFLMIADLAAGTVESLTHNLSGSRAHFDPVTWSPDGTKILVGPLLLDAATGALERTIDGVAGPPRWSQDGQWLLWQAQEWGEITAYDLSADRALSLGAGLPLGWSQEGAALLIRWPGAAHRTQWGL